MCLISSHVPVPCEWCTTTSTVVVVLKIENRYVRPITTPSCSLRAPLQALQHYSSCRTTAAGYRSGIWDLGAVRAHRIADMLRRLSSAPSIIAPARRSPRRANMNRFSNTAKDKVVDMGEVMWSPSQDRVSSSRMLAFARLAGERSGRDLRRFGLEPRHRRTTASCNRNSDSVRYTGNVDLCLVYTARPRVELHFFYTGIMCICV